MDRPRITTASLAGCFGCHMSLLDLDERIVELFAMVELDRSPLCDIRTSSRRCAVGLVEGGCANEDNVALLLQLRRRCDTLVALGDCATMGGVPALRNTVPLDDCLQRAFIDGPTLHNPSRCVPDDDELPLLLDKVYPCQDVVHIDCSVPGCPPSAECIWRALRGLLTADRSPWPYALLKYD